MYSYWLIADDPAHPRAARAALIIKYAGSLYQALNHALIYHYGESCLYDSGNTMTKLS